MLRNDCALLSGLLSRVGVKGSSLFCFSHLRFYSYCSSTSSLKGAAASTDSHLLAHPVCCYPISSHRRWMLISSPLSRLYLLFTFLSVVHLLSSHLSLCTTSISFCCCVHVEAQRVYVQIRFSSLSTLLLNADSGKIS